MRATHTKSTTLLHLAMRAPPGAQLALRLQLTMRTTTAHLTMRDHFAMLATDTFPAILLQVAMWTAMALITAVPWPPMLATVADTAVMPELAMLATTAT
mmetsp:Transcript_129800/g.416522  ORF Transcript_129800/g.416522 Transcript_129800/m.416522 type:complete len:99 (+) Transcript_129800:479-775(+)